MTAPLVSVIVPHYRHGPFLAERMASILGQTIGDLELILLDDASPDGSGEALAHYAGDPRCSHCIINEHNSGSPFRQWRKGIALAKGTWVWIAESDDSAAPDLLESLLALNAEQDDALGLVFAQSMIIDEHGREKGSWARHTACFDPDPFAQDLVLEGGDFLRSYLKVRNVIPNASGVLLRRDLLLDDALWQDVERLGMVGDWLLWTRLVQRTRVGFIARPLNHFRDHGTVTRRHGSLELKRQRLREEAVVRRVLATVPGIDQKAEVRDLYAKWTRLHPWRAIGTDAFDAVRVPGTSRAALFLFAWKEKFMERRDG